MLIRILWMLLLVVLAGMLLVGCSKASTPSGGKTSPTATTGTTQTPATSPVTSTAAQPTLPANTLATVNGRPLSREDYAGIKSSILDYYRRVYAQFGFDIQQFLAGARGRLFLLEIELAALETLIKKGLVEEEAKRRGITITEEAVAAEFQKQYTQMLEREGITEEFLAFWFQIQGSSLEQFKENARKQVGEQLLYQSVAQAVAGSVKLSEEELRQYFADNRTNYETPEEVEASHILLDTEEKAKKVLEELASGADFAALAGTYSLDPGSASRGGQLGWFGRGVMVQEFEEAAFALKVGQVSGIVKTQFGYHIIRVTGRREARQPPFEEVADRVRADAEGKVVQERFSEWLKGARDGAKVTVLDPLLDAAYKKRQDLDLGLAAFERLRKEGTVEEPYLAFLIGSIYQEKMEAAQAEKERVLAEPEAPDRALRLAELETKIASARAAALAAYREALAQVGDDAGIKLRIEALEPQAPVQTPSG